MPTMKVAGGRLNILNNNQISIPYEKELRVLANTLYQWETESRYNDSFVAAIADVDEAMTYADGLFEYISDFIKIVEVTEMTFPNKKL